LILFDFALHFVGFFSFFFQLNSSFLLTLLSLFLLCFSCVNFFFFVPTSSTWTHLWFYISSFHPFNFALSNCSFACNSPHPWPFPLCKFRFWLLTIIKLQLQTQSNCFFEFSCFICLDTLCCFFILDFKFVFCICPMTKFWDVGIWVILQFLLRFVESIIWSSTFPKTILKTTQHYFIIPKLTASFFNNYLISFPYPLVGIWKKILFHFQVKLPHSFTNKYFLTPPLLMHIFSLLLLVKLL